MPRNLILLSIDGLAAHALGPLGNTWIPTPAFDDLAARSLLLENHIIDHDTPAEVFASWWGNQHAAAERTPFSWNPIAGSERDFRLVTDEQPTAFAGMLPPEEYCQFVDQTGDGAAVTDIEDSAMGRLFVEAIESLSRAGAPFTYWIHARGFTGPWDAPFEFRQSFGTEDDPDPPDFTSPPSAICKDDPDPDVLTGISHAYAAQVMLLDACLDAFVAELRRSPPDGETLLILTSPRGYPLGNHGVIGFEGAPLRSEWLHTPLLLCRLGANEPSIREREIAQPPDVSATIHDWLSDDTEQPFTNQWGQSLLPLFEQNDWGQDRHALTVGETQRSLQTPLWRLCEERIPDDHDAHHLFAKPDDYWEANNVAALCSWEIDSLVEQAEAFQQAAAANDRKLLTPTEESTIATGDSAAENSESPS
ncbi:MAG: sulfatase-like hydrolase/transferase [bacterium]|nr:sulfatase-like hydrolase/transferase [bacterium]